MGFWTGTHNDARASDPASLFFTPSAAERRMRQRARDERDAKRRRAMKERRVKQMRREQTAGRDPMAAWRLW
jgi:hypothetical protein